jgi:hypothetical protein
MRLNKGALHPEELAGDKVAPHEKGGQPQKEQEQAVQGQDNAVESLRRDRQKGKGEAKNAVEEPDHAGILDQFTGVVDPVRGRVVLDKAKEGVDCYEE